MIYNRQRWAIRRDYIDIDGKSYPNFVFKGCRVLLFATRDTARVECRTRNKGWDAVKREYNPYPTTYHVVKVTECITENL